MKRFAIVLFVLTAWGHAVSSSGQVWTNAPPPVTPPGWTNNNAPPPPWYTTVQHAGVVAGVYSNLQFSQRGTQELTRIINALTSAATNGVNSVVNTTNPAGVASLVTNTLFIGTNVTAGSTSVLYRVESQVSGLGFTTANGPTAFLTGTVATAGSFADTNSVGVISTNAVNQSTNVAARLASNVWASADSTTNYALRSNGGISPVYGWQTSGGYDGSSYVNNFGQRIDFRTTNSARDVFNVYAVDTNQIPNNRGGMTLWAYGLAHTSSYSAGTRSPYWALGLHSVTSANQGIIVFTSSRGTNDTQHDAEFWNGSTAGGSKKVLTISAEGHLLVHTGSVTAAAGFVGNGSALTNIGAASLASSVATNIGVRLDSNVWAAANSTTNFVMRTGDTLSGPISFTAVNSTRMAIGPTNGDAWFGAFGALDTVASGIQFAPHATLSQVPVMRIGAVFNGADASFLSGPILSMSGIGELGGGIGAGDYMRLEYVGGDMVTQRLASITADAGGSSGASARFVISNGVFSGDGAAVSNISIALISNGSGILTNGGPVATNYLPRTGGTMSGPITNTAGYFGNGAGLTNIARLRVGLLAGGAEIYGSTNDAVVTSVAGTSANFTELRFSDTVAQRARWTIPAAIFRDWNGGAITSRITWKATATATNAVVWSLAFKTVGANVDPDAAYSTARGVTSSPSSTASGLVFSEITFTPATNEIFIGNPSLMELRRVPTDAADLMATNANVLTVELTQ